MRGTRAAADRRDEVRGWFSAVRTHTETLAAPLSAEDQTVQSMPDVSPTKWHLAHTSWFFETFLLVPHLRGYRVFSPSFEVLFNSYYNAVGDQFPRPQRGLLSRPGKDEVLQYRRHVTDAMKRLIDDADQAALQLTILGLHHEQQHQELILTDIKHVLSQSPLFPAYSPGAEAPPESGTSKTQPKQPSFVGFEGGTVEIGHGGGDFHFDNEGPRHKALVAEFELATRPITGQDVFTFIEAGGYDEPLLWLSDGWAFVRKHGQSCPQYWLREADGRWMHFTLHGLLSVDPRETACHLTYFEADAIARFFGGRLPTETEWEYAAQRMAPRAPSFRQEFIRPGHARPSAGAELCQLLGGVWEWTQSAYSAYPGYRTPSGAVGEYNGKFMHNQFVLRGGSCATPEGHVRITYRNFFPSHASWQFSGARIARGNETP